MRFCLQVTVAIVAGALSTSALAHEEKLEGSEWGMVGDPETGGRFISFAGQGRLFGFGGCNRLNGTYTQHDGHLTISDIATTRMGCDADIMRREAEFIAMLGKVRGAKADHTLLLLLDEAGSDLRTLIRRSPEPPSTEE